MSTIIPRNTAIPIDKKKQYTTNVDNQTSVHIKVHQGEQVFADDNHKIGDFRVNGLMAAPKHQEKVDVTFRIDANGIL